MQAKYDAANPAALKRLVAGGVRSTGSLNECAIALEMAVYVCCSAVYKY